jgi:very-short-patch-repair endonuclease
MTGFPTGPLVLTVPHSGHRRIPGVTVHQISDLTADSCVLIDGLPHTTPARTLVDLAATTRMGRLAAALDDAVVSQRITSFAAVGRELAKVARRGKPGVRVLMVLLDERGPGEEPPQSQLELSLFGLIRAARLPAPIRQFAFPGQVFTRGCVDAAYPDARLILEADGRRWHTRIKDLARDHERDAEALRAGWATLRLLHEHIVDEAEWTAQLIRDTRARRIAQLTPNSTS